MVRIVVMGKVQAVVSGHTHFELKGQVMRPGFPEGRTLPVFVLGSNYRAPVYRVIDSALLADGRVVRM